MSEASVRLAECVIYFVIYSGERDDLTVKEVDPAMRIIFGDEVMDAIKEKYKVKEK